MFAMATFLQGYCKNCDNSNKICEAVLRWLECNKPHLPHNDHTPCTILVNYCVEMQFTEDRIDSKMDWDYLSSSDNADDSSE